MLSCAARVQAMHAYSNKKKMCAKGSRNPDEILPEIKNRRISAGVGSCVDRDNALRNCWNSVLSEVGGHFGELRIQGNQLRKPLQAVVPQRQGIRSSLPISRSNL